MHPVIKEAGPKGHPRKQIRLWKTPLQKIMSMTVPDIIMSTAIPGIIMTMGIITMSVR